jgi:hypothetical protein
MCSLEFDNKVTWFLETRMDWMDWMDCWETGRVRTDRFSRTVQ